MRTYQLLQLQGIPWQTVLTMKIKTKKVQNSLPEEVSRKIHLQLQGFLKVDKAVKRTMYIKNMNKTKMREKMWGNKTCF